MKKSLSTILFLLIAGLTLNCDNTSSASVDMASFIIGNWKLTHGWSSTKLIAKKNNTIIIDTTEIEDSTFTKITQLSVITEDTINEYANLDSITSKESLYYTISGTKMTVHSSDTSMAFTITKNGSDLIVSLNGEMSYVLDSIDYTYIFSSKDTYKPYTGNVPPSDWPAIGRCIGYMKSRFFLRKKRLR